jgi:hypothetical protein
MKDMKVFTVYGFKYSELKFAITFIDIPKAGIPVTKRDPRKLLNGNVASDFSPLREHKN